MFFISTVWPRLVRQYVLKKVCTKWNQHYKRTYCSRLFLSQKIHTKKGLSGHQIALKEVVLNKVTLYVWKKSMIQL